MPRLKAANNAQTTLAASCTAVDTVITVTDVSKFPAPPFRITIDAEIMEVTAVDYVNKQFTVLRGLEGTTAAAHNVGAMVENRFTAGTFDELVDITYLEDQLENQLNNLNNHAANSSHVPYAVATGSANNYSVTINPAPSGYVEGMAVAVKINVDNTGPSTINVNGMGPKPIKKPNGNDVSAGNLRAGSIYTLRYNGTNFILQGEGGGGNAQPGDVLSGKTFTNDFGEQVGTMPNRGAMIITPGTSNITIPAGYHNGSGYVKGDPNLVPENIKQGVSIFGVSGTVVQYKEASGSISTGGGVKQVSNLNFTPKVIFLMYESLDEDWLGTRCYGIYTSAVGAINEYQVGWLGPPIGLGICNIVVFYNRFTFYSPDNSNILPGIVYWKAYGI